MEGAVRKWYTLYDKIFAITNLQKAWEKVKRNKGAGGIDKVTIEQYEKNKEINIQELHRLLKEKRYNPKAVKRVYIPKSDGKLRPLGIPTIRDRIVQQAVVNVIESIFEKKFCDCSYGFRPGRNAHQAIGKIKEYYEAGYQWVLDADIQAYFDNINHDILMNFIEEEIIDGSVLKLIRAWLTAGVMDGMKEIKASTGTPQGGVISPLLANIYLHHFDKRMSERGYRLVRYADDFVILCKLERKAERALEVVKEIIEGKLKLTIHPDKTRIIHFNNGFEFLGFKFYRKYTGPRAKSLDKFKEKVRQATRRQQGNNLRFVIKNLNPIILGWGNYYKRSYVKKLFTDLDKWIRMRIRAFIEKKKAVKHQNRRIPNKWLADKGLKSLCSLLA